VWSPSTSADARGRSSICGCAPRVGDLQTELVQDFFEAFAAGARANVHVAVKYGRSSHHQVEAIFKAFARALRVACAKDRRLARMLPSTKGIL
jgi:imidazoleglycerol-phosphate dehydratase